MIRRLMARLGLGRAPARTRAPPPRAPARPRPKRSAPPAPRPASVGAPSLVLYKYDACPYCRRVQDHLVRIGLDIPQRDTRSEPAARDALRALTGRTQVPCLVIDGQPMLESADIIDWLDANLGTLQPSRT